MITITKATEIATQSAIRSNMRFKLGAVLFDRTKYVTGWNRGFGVTVNSRSQPWSVHAEEMAILKGVRIGIDFSNSTMVVVRINRSGNLRVSRPCETCSRLIERVGIRTIHYVG